MKKISKILSAIFSPLIVPCYGIAMSLCVTPLFVIPFKTRAMVLGMCAIFLFLLPALSVMGLYRMGIIKDVGLNNRNERTVPYLVTMACYGVCAYYLYRINAPFWLVGFIVGGLLTIFVNLLVNLRWKISGHMAAMGGWLGVTFFIALNHLAVINMMWIVIVIVILAGVVGTARLILERHTPMQLLAGTANGFLSIYLCAWLLSMIGNPI